MDYDQALQMRREEIASVFKAARTTNPRYLSLPYTKYGFKVSRIPLSEVVADAVADDKVLDLLMTVMEKSDCPLIAEFFQQVEASYESRNAEDLAGIDAQWEEA